MRLRLAVCMMVVSLCQLAPAFARHRESGEVQCGKFGCTNREDTLDPDKRACGAKVGAYYNWPYHHWDGTPAAMDAFYICMGMPPWHGPPAEGVRCAKQVGAHFNERNRHFEGTPEIMAAFRACRGFN